MDSNIGADEVSAEPVDQDVFPEDFEASTDVFPRQESVDPAEFNVAPMMHEDSGMDSEAFEPFGEFDGGWSPPFDFDSQSDSYRDGEFSGAYSSQVVTTMESAICTGAEEEVSALLVLLEGMNKTALTRELTGCYGGRREHPPCADENGLFRMTVPLLHAAFTGSTAIFSTVLGAIRGKLTAGQVKRAVAARDGNSRSLLHMAISSNNKHMFEAALGVVEEVLTKDEVKELITAPDADGQIILHWAAAVGNKGMLDTVLGSLKSRLSQEQVKHLIAASTAASTDDVFSESKTVLNSAASSGDKDVFDAILAELETYWPAWRVKRMMIYQDMGLQENLLHSAIKSGSTVVFGAVLDSLTSRLTPTEVRDVLLRVYKSKNILHAAAERGDKDVFGAVLAALHHECGPEKVRKVLGSTAKHGKTILQFAAQSGKKEGFEAVLATVKGLFAADKVKVMMLWSKNREESILRLAASSGSRDAFESVLAALESDLSQEEARAALLSAGGGKKTILHLAARSGSKDVFEAALAALSSEEVVSIVSQPEALEGLLVAAAKSGNIGVWQAIIKEVEGDMTFDEQSVGVLLRTAAFQGNVRMWDAVVADLSVQEEQVRDCILGNADLATGVLKGAIKSRDPATVRAVVGLVRGEPPHQQAPAYFGDLIESGFSHWTTVVLEKAKVGPGAGGGGLDWAIEALSCLLQYPASFASADLIQLSRGQSTEWMKFCFLETVVCSDNPFIPGMALSIAFAKSAVIAPEGERRKLLFLQESVDTLLLEVLERLPQTVQGFDGRMSGCSSVFEPEYSNDGTAGFPGPLRMAMQERQHIQTFCTQPLLMDFLSRRFTHGLPGLRDTQNVLGDRSELTNLASGGPEERLSGQQYLALDEEERKQEDRRCLNRCLLLDFEDKISQERALLDAGKMLDSFLSPCILLQGANCGGLWNASVGLTFLPGAQFTLAGVAAMPDQYYRVPALRMVLDLAVYLIMLTVFSTVVLFHEDGPLTPGEILFAFYLLAGATTEWGEMKRDFSLYLTDHWNFLDLLGLGFVAGGLIVRCVDGTNPWGRALYALSAPLIFARLLFFAQMLRFHGPMIQVVFSMTAELVKFGVVIIVVMLGFAMSFHALYGGVATFGETCLTLFKAMLGEVGFFDDFPGGDFNAVATALFVIYLVVIAVMLLNLLIAVLSTSHSKVEGKADQEFKVSKARMIEHYRLVVDLCLLPPPFNLVQLLLSSPILVVYWSWHGPASRRAKDVVGRVVFWVVLGPAAVVGGTLLWLMSSFYAPFMWKRHFFSKERAKHAELSSASIWLRYVLVFLWCCLGAPIYLAAFWVTAPMKWCNLRPWRWLWNRRQAPFIASWKPKGVNDLLEQCNGGMGVMAGDLQSYLEDPISDPEVRQDERTRHTTVEHIKQLRDRLEKTSKTYLDVRLKQVEEEITKSAFHTNTRLAAVEMAIVEVQAHLERRLARVEQDVTNSLEKMDEKLNKLVSIAGKAGTSDNRL